MLFPNLLYSLLVRHVVRICFSCPLAFSHCGGSCLCPLFKTRQAALDPLPSVRLNGRGSTPMVPFWVGAPPFLEPNLVGIESDVHWGLSRLLTHSQMRVGKGARVPWRLGDLVCLAGVMRVAWSQGFRDARVYPCRA